MENTRISVKREYEKYQKKILELKFKKLDILVALRKKIDNNKVHGLKEQIQQIYGRR